MPISNSRICCPKAVRNWSLQFRALLDTWFKNRLHQVHLEQNQTLRPSRMSAHKRYLLRVQTSQSHKSWTSSNIQKASSSAEHSRSIKIDFPSIEDKPCKMHGDHGKVIQSRFYQLSKNRNQYVSQINQFKRDRENISKRRRRFWIWIICELTYLRRHVGRSKSWDEGW